MSSSDERGSQTPADYIKALQGKHPAKASNPVNISEALVELHGGDRQRLEEILEATRDEDYAKRLLIRLQPGLPECFGELIDEGVVAVGEVNDPAPNASVKRLDGPCYAIMFNMGLQRFIYRFTRALSTRFTPQGSEAEPEVSFEDACRILTDIFFWFVETGEAFGPSYSVTGEQLKIASILATEAESFLLAHEFGHVWEDLRGLVDGKEGIDAESHPWTDEFAADAFACTALINSRNQEDGPVSLDMSYAGAEIAIAIFAGLESLGVEFEQTHPAATERLRHLREHMRDLCTDDDTYRTLRSLSEPIDQVLGKILQQLQAPDWEAFLERAAAPVISELDALLDRCTGGGVPDYVTFRSEFGAILERIPSNRVYARIAQASAVFFEHMRAVNAHGRAAVDRDGWVAFQKYKLFMSFVRDLTSPSKELFEDALGLSAN